MCSALSAPQIKTFSACEATALTQNTISSILINFNLVLNVQWVFHQFSILIGHIKYLTAGCMSMGDSFSPFSSPHTFSLVFLKTNGMLLHQCRAPIASSSEKTYCFRIPPSWISFPSQAVKQRMILEVPRYHCIITLLFERQYLLQSCLTKNVTLSSELKHSPIDDVKRSHSFHFSWGNVHRFCH